MGVVSDHTLSTETVYKMCMCPVVDDIVLDVRAGYEPVLCT